jgi:hypothetical protein
MVLQRQEAIAVPQTHLRQSYEYDKSIGKRDLDSERPPIIEESGHEMGLCRKLPGVAQQTSVLACRSCLIRPGVSPPVLSHLSGNASIIGPSWLSAHDACFYDCTIMALNTLLHSVQAQHVWGPRLLLM